jgi:hypothetical protein
VPTADAHPEEAIGVPSGLKNWTEAAVVTNSSGVFISIVCVIVWVLTNVPLSVISAMLLALYESWPVRIHTPWPGVRCAGKNAGLDVVSVNVPPRANDPIEINGVASATWVWQSTRVTCVIHVPSNVLPSPSRSFHCAAAFAVGMVAIIPANATTQNVFKQFVFIDFLLGYCRYSAD